MSAGLTLDARKARVKERIPLVSEVEKHVKLSGSSGAKNRRGKCPFHNGNSASFSLKADQDFAHCFGCGWNGDVIRFTMDRLGLSFMDALQSLEAEIGEGVVPAVQGRGPVQRERNPTAVRRPAARKPVESIDMGRWIWKRSVRCEWPPLTSRYVTARERSLATALKVWTSRSASLLMPWSS